jgi:Agrobacterium tumefaciens protein Atu4866
MKGVMWFALAALAGGCMSGAIPASAESAGVQHIQAEREVPQHPYIGMWITPDGHIRHELLASGRYDEARGQRESAYQGRYEITGNRINYWDDTGFTADGTFVNPDELHHGGMIFLRKK